MYVRVNSEYTGDVMREWNERSSGRSGGAEGKLVVELILVLSYFK